MFFHLCMQAHITITTYKIPYLALGSCYYLMNRASNYEDSAWTSVIHTHFALNNSPSVFYNAANPPVNVAAQHVIDPCGFAQADGSVCVVRETFPDQIKQIVSLVTSPATGAYTWNMSGSLHASNCQVLAPDPYVVL